MDKKNQRNFMDWLRKYLNIKTIEELYQLTQGDITVRSIDLYLTDLGKWRERITCTL